MKADMVQLEPDPTTGRDLAPHEQQRECPECGAVFTLRGLYGHLRLAHGKKGQALTKGAEQSKPAVITEVEEISELLKRYRSLYTLWLELRRLHEQGCFKRKADFTRLHAAIDRQADAVEEKLKGHGITINNAYREALNDEIEGTDAAPDTGEEN